MNDLTDEIKKILIEEQNNIINCTEKYILVTACPGSGKTYTIVKRIEKELEEIHDYQGIIACSFTKESSEELKSRINPKYDLQNCYIGTIDSLIKNIVCIFLNRALKESNIFESQVIIGNNIILGQNEVNINNHTIKKGNGNNLTLNEIIKNYDINAYYKNIGNKYYSEWLKKLKGGTYEVSYPAYFLASYIVKMEIFKNWFDKKFTTIYVDEAQDLNYFQHYFFNVLKENTNINIVMVGDPNQSIYQFRGAKPKLFNELKNRGFNEYKITVSLRCDPSISYFSNRIYNYDLEKKFNFDNKVKKIDEITDELLDELSENTFILTKSNSTAQQLYELYKEKFDIKYTKKIDLDNKKYNDYYLNCDVLDELLKYYLNYDNEIDKYKYPYENIEKILLAYNPKIKSKNFIISKNLNLVDFLIKSIDILKINVSIETVNEIVKLMEETMYRYNYYIVEKTNRIMTIHTSKGLENDNVIIVWDNQYATVGDVFKNELFVAMTRARKNVYIIVKNNEVISKYIDYLLK